MGNQLTGIAPSQILPVEHYLTDVSDYEFDTSLGSTRFFKVARARFKEGLAVVKVFAIHDPSLPLKAHKDQVEEIKKKLSNSSNCLPFLRSTLSDKAALLFRQYVRNNLYDRISTRPFMCTIEKKWIAFQLLCALNQAHRVKVCHGDIKSENVMVTGWNWVLLTDFASFKPTYLPADNPADFSFFFDTSRRRTCYIAPERFLEGSIRQSESYTVDNPEGLQETGNILKGELTPAMDIFSAGCVIAELFTDGKPPFDLSQLLAYRNDQYDPNDVLDLIEDEDIKSLIQHMIQKDPSKRFTSEDYLVQWRDKVFPEVFYTYLKRYLGEFADVPILPADEKIARLRPDISTILSTVCPAGEDKEPNRDINSGLVIILTLLTSCLRTLKFCTSKLAALEILLMIAQHIPDEIILDRIIPYMLHFVNDPLPRVRAEAVRTLTQTLTIVKSVPRSDANIFPEYILPNLSPATQDEIVMVRVAYAENIAVLSETALRFLEMVQLEQTTQTNGGSQDISVQYQASYDDELQNLHEMIQQKVVTLLSDSENVVKQTLLENGITRLCVFFGRQKANDVLLSHMITFLNDKNDWHLRGAFFDSIVGVAAYVGWQSSFILKPLIQQGLCDSEEFVICKAMAALTNLVELGLLQKPVILDLTSEVVPYLCHPSSWVRNCTAGMVASVANSLNIADVHCNLVPMLQPYIKQQIIQVEKEPILLSVLKEPVPRAVYDYILRTPYIESFFDNLHDRQLIRNLCRPGHKPSYSQPEDVQLAQLFRKLQSQGMTEEHEDKLLLLKDIMLKQQKAKSSSIEQSLPSPGPDQPTQPGIINLVQLDKPIQRNHADLITRSDLRGDPSDKAQARKLRKKISVMQDSAVNEEWKSMFGSAEPSKSSKSSPSIAPVQPAQDALTMLPQSPQSTPQTVQQPTTQPQATDNKNEEWKSMFGSAEPSKSSKSSPSIAPVQPAQDALTMLPQSPQSTPQTVQQPTTQPQTTDPPPQGLPVQGLSTVGPISMSQLQAAADGVPQKKPSLQENKPPSRSKIAACKLDLHRLVQRKREQYTADISRKLLIEDTAFEAKTPSPSWKPKGLLVAHLHEHKAAVNRVEVSQDHSLFATGSSDGTVKIWDCSKLIGKSNTNRSRQTYNRQTGKIRALTFCQASHSIASASDDGSIHVFRIEANPPRISLLHKTNLDPDEEGCVVDMKHFDTGSQAILTYATVQGYLIGWDLRAPGGVAWRLRNDPKHGLVTSFVVDPQQCWMAVGTSNGSHVCWDLRFQLPITTIQHPTGARVRRLYLHPSQPSWIISAVQGNNEVSMWDLETGARQLTLWASASPALSQTQATPHAVHGVYCIPSNSIEQQPRMLTAGSDQRIRYWDVQDPSNSSIVVGSVNDTQTQPGVSYDHRVIDGTEVIVETYGKHRGGSSSDDTIRKSPDQVPVGHRDIITDIAAFQTSSSSAALITTSRDGVVKIWK